MSRGGVPVAGVRRARGEVSPTSPRSRSTPSAERPALDARAQRQQPPETIGLIRDIAARGRLWGAERIRGELLKLGDQATVTLFGESAGAWSTCAHLAMPGSRGLFARALMQSGACSNALYFAPETANAQGDELGAAVGCTGSDVAACLRGKSADEIVAALPLKRGL